MAYKPKTVVEDDIPAESKGPKPKKGPKTVKPEAKTLLNTKPAKERNRKSPLPRSSGGSKSTGKVTPTKSKKDKFKDSVKGYVKSGVDTVSSLLEKTPMVSAYRSAKAGRGKTAATAAKKAIEKGALREYGESRMAGLKAVPKSAIKTSEPMRSPAMRGPAMPVGKPSMPLSRKASPLAPMAPMRPKARPKLMEEDDYGAVDRGNRAAQLEGMKHGGKVKTMRSGGASTCRGMGAATRGGNYKA
jgi:hypothetical protein